MLRTAYLSARQRYRECKAALRDFRRRQFGTPSQHGMRADGADTDLPPGLDPLQPTLDYFW
eukprot:3034799-Alexandrium_andersonii.AAC.1